VLLAVGFVMAEQWWAGGTGRRTLLTGVVAVQAPLSMMFALPVLPASVEGRAPVLAVNETLGEQIGWPQLTAQVAAVYHSLPPAQRARVILAADFALAGAIRHTGCRAPTAHTTPTTTGDTHPTPLRWCSRSVGPERARPVVRRLHTAHAYRQRTGRV